MKMTKGMAKRQERKEQLRTARTRAKRKKIGERDIVGS